MMDHDDFEEIKRLLEKCCDNCLLTRMHCTGCRIDKLRSIVGEFSKTKPFEVILMNVEDLKVLLNLSQTSKQAGEKELEVLENWGRVVAALDGREAPDETGAG